MPKRKTTLAAEANAARMPQIPKELSDQFVTDGSMTAEAVNAASLAFKKALIERALGAELSHHLGFAAGDKPLDSTNLRNGKTPKTVMTEDGPVRLEIPRDRFMKTNGADRY